MSKSYNLTNPRQTFNPEELGRVQDHTVQVETNTRVRTELDFGEYIEDQVEHLDDEGRHALKFDDGRRY